MSDWVDPDDAPLLTKEFFDRAEIRIGGKVVREASGTLTKDWSKTGRPPVGDTPKEAVSLRLDRDMVAKFRESGPGWQTRMNAALRKAAGLG
ncbi:MAG: BrnA antitoxin family protein [Sphingomonas sp.]